MRSGSHVQLAALQNRNLELQTTSPFSNHGSVERSTACCHHKNVLHVWISSIFVRVFKSSLFFLSPCINIFGFGYNVDPYLGHHQAWRMTLERVVHV
jgi:hypothetical protein